MSASLPDRDESVPIEALLSHRSGCLILLGPKSDVSQIQALLDQVPVVVVGRRLTEDAQPAAHGLATVRTDDAKGIREAVAYLVELGHRDITHVDGGSDPGSADRRRAYRTAMRSHGLSDHARVIAAAHTENAGAAAAQTMLADAALPTAVLASNDRCALGLLDGFTRAGIDVPGQLSLIGYDDSRLSDNPRIHLTTVHQDAEAMASHAVRLAVEILREAESTGRRRGCGARTDAGRPRHHRGAGSAVDERGLEVVARRAINVAAVLDDAPRIVERGPVHHQQRRLRLLVEQPRLVAVGRLRPDALAGEPECTPRDRSA